MRYFIMTLSLGLTAALGGCVATSDSPVDADPAPGPQESAALPAALPREGASPGPDFATTAAAPAASGVAPADPTFEWQRALADDVALVETRGDAFLDVSFKLYDRLLDGDTTEATAAAALTLEVQQSADLYADLTAAVDRLRLDLAKPEIKASLPLATAEGRQEWDTTQALFAAYPTLPKRGVTYDLANGRGITAVLFADRGGPEKPELASLPKPQRDALSLLDSLRDIGSDLAYVSHTVTDWVDVRGRLGAENEAFSH